MGGLATDKVSTKALAKQMSTHPINSGDSSRQSVVSFGGRSLELLGELASTSVGMALGSVVELKSVDDLGVACNEQTNLRSKVALGGAPRHPLQGGKVDKEKRT